MLSFVLAASLFGVEIEPPPLDPASMRALISDVQMLKARVDALEKRCTCGATTALQAVPASTPMVQVCGPNGCQMVPANSVGATYSGQSFSQSFSSDGGSCANGSCGGGQSSGRRGLFRRR